MSTDINPGGQTMDHQDILLMLNSLEMTLDFRAAVDADAAMDMPVSVVRSIVSILRMNLDMMTDLEAKTAMMHGNFASSFAAATIREMQLRNALREAHLSLLTTKGFPTEASNTVLKIIDAIDRTIIPETQRP